MFRLDERRGQPVRGLSCDEGGVFMDGDIPLVTMALENGRRLYRANASEKINKGLSNRYGSSFEIGSRIAVLKRIAELLTTGELGKAQIMTLQMDWADVDGDEARGRLVNSANLLQFNPNHYPPGPKGGRFAPSNNAGQGDGPLVRARSEATDVVIERPDGSTERRVGGSLAWRNNNPGNIGPTPWAVIRERR